MDKTTIYQLPNLDKHPCFTPLCGAVPYREGNLRGVSLDDGDLMNTERLLGMKRAVSEALEEAFGKTSIEEQMDEDRRAYEIKPIY